MDGHTSVVIAKTRRQAALFHTIYYTTSDHSINGQFIAKINGVSYTISDCEWVQFCCSSGI